MTTFTADNRSMDALFENLYRFAMTPRTNVTAGEFPKGALWVGESLNIPMAICAF
jgi:hypothetical protein